MRARTRRLRAAFLVMPTSDRHLRHVRRPPSGHAGAAWTTIGAALREVSLPLPPSWLGWGEPPEVRRGGRRHECSIGRRRRRVPTRLQRPSSSTPRPMCLSSSERPVVPPNGLAHRHYCVVHGSLNVPP